MKIVVVGVGKVGSILADQLVAENHDIIAVDADAEALRHCTEKYDIMGFVGNGATVALQREAGVAEADLLIATTPLDERNLLACLVAKNLGVRHTIARVRNPEYTSQMDFLKSDLGLSMTINPELEAAAEISRILRYPTALKINPFARGKAEMLEIKLANDNPLVGMSLIAIRAKYQLKILVCAVQRGEEVFIPNGNFVLQENDRLTLIGAPGDVNMFFVRLGLLKSKVKNVMIVGGGKICHYLTQQLCSAGISVKIIEQSPERCRELCEALPEATVICGNGINQDLLAEEGIESTDSFVALTGIDEENLIVSMCAQASGVKKVITKVSNFNQPALITKLGLDTVISPKRLTADGIVRYVRAMHNNTDSTIETLYKLLDGKVEAIDFHILGESELLGKPLREFNFKPQILIACVVRHGAAIIADGGTVIQPGDNLIVISGREMIQNVKDIIL